MGIKGQKRVQKFPSQPVFGVGHRVIQHAARDCPQFFREAIPGRVDVDPYPQHHGFHRAGFQSHGGFRENAADLFPPEEQVVDPLDSRGLPGKLLHRPAHGRSSGGGQTHRLPGRIGRGPQQQTQIKAGIGGREKAPSQPPPSGGLLPGNNHAALRRSLRCPLPNHGVGGVGCWKHRHIQAPELRLQVFDYPYILQ